MMKKAIFRLIQLATFNYYFQRKNGNRLYVLMFHQVNDDKRSIYRATPIQAFEKICAFLSKHAQVIHFSEIDQLSSNAKKPSVIISFDDGHYDIVQHALPILQKYNLKFNVNIDTEILETGLPQDNVRVYDILNQSHETSYSNPKYFDQAIGIPKNTETEIQFSKVLRKLKRTERREFSDHLLKSIGHPGIVFSKVLSKDDLISLDKLGVEIGSHSHSHAMLIHQSEEEIKLELEFSKNTLQSILQKPVKIIAYPNGLTNDSIDAISKKLDYEYFLYTEDLSNPIDGLNKEKMYRINMYHQSFEECLAHVFGLHRKLQAIKKLPL